jgi:hypothetical protein
MGVLRRRLRFLSVGPRSPINVARASTPPSIDWREHFSHPKWREALIDPATDGRPDLRGARFDGLSLTGLDFTRCRLDRATFREATLTRCDFSRSDLPGAIFTGATLKDVQLDAVNATEARFDSAHVEGTATFVASNLAFTSFRRARLDGADLSGATFFSADLRNASFRQTRRHATDFEEADTTCVHVEVTRPTIWTKYAGDCGAPSFSAALAHYSSLKGLGSERALRAVEAGVERADSVVDEVRGLLTSELGWRVQIVGACAIAMAAAEPELVDLLWDHIRANSWVSPQLAVAVKLIDDDFAAHAAAVLADESVSLKARGAVAALLAPGEVDAGLERTLAVTGKEGFELAKRWSHRLDMLTEELGPVGSFE